jgi:hypothetical protein
VGVDVGVADGIGVQTGKVVGVAVAGGIGVMVGVDKLRVVPVAIGVTVPTGWENSRLWGPGIPESVGVGVFVAVLVGAGV